MKNLNKVLLLSLLIFGSCAQSTKYRKLSSVNEDIVNKKVNRVVNMCDGLLNASDETRSKAFYITLIPQAALVASGAYMSYIIAGHFATATTTDKQILTTTTVGWFP